MENVRGGDKVHGPGCGSREQGKINLVCRSCDTMCAHVLSYVLMGNKTSLYTMGLEHL